MLKKILLILLFIPSFLYSNDLDVTINMEKEEYYYGEPIALNVIFNNISSKNMAITYNLDYENDIHVAIYFKKKHEEKYRLFPRSGTALLAYSMKGPKLWDFEGFDLNPGEEISKRYIIHVSYESIYEARKYKKELDYFHFKPGNYKIYFEYKFPSKLKKNFIPNTKFWFGKRKSNIIDFSVIKAPLKYLTLLKKYKNYFLLTGCARSSGSMLFPYEKPIELKKGESKKTRIRKKQWDDESWFHYFNNILLLEDNLYSDYLKYFSVNNILELMKSKMDRDKKTKPDRSQLNKIEDTINKFNNNRKEFLFLSELNYKLACFYYKVNKGNKADAILKQLLEKKNFKRNGTIKYLLNQKNKKKVLKRLR